VIATGSRHKFVGALGHTSEDETGLIYMRARWMDPSLGRFISEDPARDGANWFEYCRGNPVNLLDRDGRSPDGTVSAGDVIRLLVYSGLMMLGLAMSPLARMIGISFVTLFGTLLASAAGGPVAMGYAAWYVLVGSGEGSIMAQLRAAAYAPMRGQDVGNAGPASQAVAVGVAYGNALFIAAWLLDNT